MDRILFDENCSDAFVQRMVGEILGKAKDERIRATVIWEPNHIEMTVEPWEPYKMECPYGRKE